MLLLAFWIPVDILVVFFEPLTVVAGLSWMFLCPAIAFAAVSGDVGIAAMRALARVYFANGGETLQFNVFSVDQLKDAQAHPWRYQNLQVRVCGWNVRWNDLSKVEQDKYILRAAGIANGR